MVKRKAKLSIFLLIAFLLAVCAAVFTVDSYAAGPPINKILIPNRGVDFVKVKDANGQTTIKNRTVSVTFATTESMIFVVPIKAEVRGDSSTYITGGLSLQLRNASGALIQNDYINMNGFEDGGWIDDWYYSDNYFQGPGKYTYTLIYSGNENFHVDFSVIGCTGFAQKATMKKKASKASDSWVKIGHLGPGYPFANASLSKKGVVPYLDIEADGDVYAYCRKKGNCKVTLKLKNGKKYVTKVKVTAGQPDFDACLYDYSTRGNYFTAIVHNNSNSPVTIIRKGAKVKDDDYKSLDRKIKGQKSITVKPGQTKWIKFKVKGRVTWYDSDDFTLFANVKYEGKKYKWKVWYEDSFYKRGGKWWTTYDYEDDYSDWLENY